MVLFTYRRGKVKSDSMKQHRMFHARKFDHTHVEGGRYKRESFTPAERAAATRSSRRKGYVAPGIRRFERRS